MNVYLRREFTVREYSESSACNFHSPNKDGEPSAHLPCIVIEIFAPEAFREYRPNGPCGQGFQLLTKTLPSGQCVFFATIFMITAHGF